MSVLSIPSALEQEIVARFGLVPNFFCSAPDAPEIVERLWGFAKSAYLDNPIPSLFKERLYVYLSRFCSVRYCIVRHSAFLLGYGYSAGDPTARPQSVAQVVRLLSSPSPWQRNSEAVLEALEGRRGGADWPAPETEFEDHLISAATLVFVEPARASRARKALRHALGGTRFELLVGLLAFIRTAHYWTVMHPDLQHEEDVRSVLAAHEDLARLLLDDPEAGRSDISARLHAELEDLRALNERLELEKSQRALRAELVAKDLLIKETNHRVKNSLQIVSSILRLQIPAAASPEAAEAVRSAAARVLAIAAVHERLYTGDDIHVVALDVFLGDLCRDIRNSLDRPDGLVADLAPVPVPTDMAVPLALIVNELVANCVRHGGPPCHVSTRIGPDGRLNLTVADNGPGPSESTPRTGLGSRIVAAFAAQLGATVEPVRGPQGYAVHLSMPRPQPRDR